MEVQVTNTEMALTLLNNNFDTLSKIALINLPEGSSMKKAQQLVLKEITNFEMVCAMKPELANLDKQSILIAVKQCIADNLTLSANAGLVYLYPGKVCVGQNGSTKIYKDVLVYQPTAEGELSISRQSGSILDHKRPVCTFDSNGQVDTVTFEFLVPTNEKPRWEKVTFNKDNFTKWKQKSAAKFGGTPNANYTSWNGGIDPEFAASKAIKHGLKKRGRNSNEVHHAPVNNNVENIANIEKPEQPINSTTTENLQERIEVIKKENTTVSDVAFEEVPAIQTETQPQKQTNEVTENDLF